MILKILGELVIAWVLLIFLFACVDKVLAPFLGTFGKILSNLYRIISKPIHKLFVVFDKWNKNPPKKDFESI